MSRYLRRGKNKSDRSYLSGAFPGQVTCDIVTVETMAQCHIPFVKNAFLDTVNIQKF